MDQSRNILITGATGFIGTHLVRMLPHKLKLALRREDIAVSNACRIPSIDGNTDWNAALEGVDTVVHLAAHVHVLNQRQHDKQMFRETNVLGTARLAESAAKCGVRRFVFLSTVKVNGEQTLPGRPFDELSVPNPFDEYAASKWEAEKLLRQIASASKMQYVAIRTPLVYGPGVRANFLRLMSWIYKGVPLPVGAVDNRRSMVSVWNLCDLIRRTIEVATLESGPLMVSDDEDVSTPDLIRRLGRSMRRPTRVISIYPGLIAAIAKLTGRQAEVSRLLSSLTVDIGATKRKLGWSPPISLDESIDRTSQWYLNELVPHRA